MNERIKELESQCWVKVPCDFDMREGGLSTIRTVFDRQKFAELIVKECIRVPYDMWDKAELNADIALKIEHRIRDHFWMFEE